LGISIRLNSLPCRNQGQVYDTGAYTHELLCADLTQKNVIPSKTRINARSISEFADWIRHEGDDFLPVLEGAIELHTEIYQPVKLETGDSAYFDARMGHLCISISEQDALILWVPSHSQGFMPAQSRGASIFWHPSERRVLCPRARNSRIKSARNMPPRII
jgi:hypothetical protein